MNNSKIPKKYSDCYIYKANVYETSLVKYINRATILDKQDSQFVDIMNIFKNSYPRWLYKFTNSDSLQFLIPAKNAGVNKAFNGFACIKNHNGKPIPLALVNGYILDRHIKSNKYVLNSSSESIMMGYIVSAFNSYTYLMNPSVFTKNAVVSKDGAHIFANFISHVLHYMYKIRSIPKVANEVTHMAKMYYYVNIMRYDVNKAVELVNRTTDLTSSHIAVINADDPGVYVDINTFVTKALATIPVMNKLTTALFVEKWIQLFGVGTEFALELLPAFLTMLTNQYVSSYATNINTVQSIIGHKNAIGAEVMKIGGKIYG